MSLISIKASLDFDPKDYTRKHEKQSSWKKVCIANIEGDLCDYYSWFLKKRFNLILNKPLRKAHLTIVNDRSSDIKRWDYIKKKYQGKEIELTYDTDIRSNGEYWWLRAESNDARYLRSRLGLDPNPFFNYHITVGFPNEKYLDHSHYILKSCEFFNNHDSMSRQDIFKQ